MAAEYLLSEDKENGKPTSSKWKARKKRKVSRKIDEDENGNITSARKNGITMAVFSI